MLFAEGNPRLVGILQRRDATRTLLLHHYKIWITSVPTIGSWFGCKYHVNGEEGGGCGAKYRPFTKISTSPELVHSCTGSQVWSLWRCLCARTPAGFSGQPASQPSAAIPAVPSPSAGSGLQIKALHAGTRIALRSFKAWMQGEPVAWGWWCDAHGVIKGAFGVCLLVTSLSVSPVRPMDALQSDINQRRAEAETCGGQRDGWSCRCRTL